MHNMHKLYIAWRECKNVKCLCPLHALHAGDICATIADTNVVTFKSVFVEQLFWLGL